MTHGPAPNDATLIALRPAHVARYRRQFPSSELVRVRWANVADSESSGERVWLSALDFRKDERISRDSILSRSPRYAAQNWTSWQRGEADVLYVLVRNQVRQLLRVSARTPPAGPPVTAPAVSESTISSIRGAAPLDSPLELSSTWRLSSPDRELDAHASGGTQAAWIASRHLATFVAYLERDAAVPWSSLSVLPASNGYVLLDALPRWQRFALATRLRIESVSRQTEEDSSSCPSATTLYLDATLATPDVLRESPPPPGEYLVRVDNGEARIERLGANARSLSTLFTADTISQTDEPANETEPSLAHDTLDPSDVEAVSGVSRWLDAATAADAANDETRRLASDLDAAFSGESEVESEDASVAESLHSPSTDSREGKPRTGWLRHLIDRTLPSGLRRALDRRSKRALAKPDDRLRAVRRQSRALNSLAQGLGGANWRDALRVSLPLREPRDHERGSRWLSSAPEFGAKNLEFSIEALESKAAHGVVPVGPEIYRRFEVLYRHAAEKLVAIGEIRRAAHVFSYLLGDHLRAAALLEQGGFPREAATVYYHLAERPRRAAVALARAGLGAEAARIWMDCSEWRHAASCWDDAGDGLQAHAAWRKVAVDLAAAGRLVEAAEIHRSKLDEQMASIALLERGARSFDRHWLEALRRALAELAHIGDRRRAAELVLETIAATDREARERARLPALRRLFDLVRTLVRVRADLGDLVSNDALREAWTGAAIAWCGVRDGIAPTPRAEIDARALAQAEAVALVLVDSTLHGDVSSWLAAPVEFASTQRPQEEVHRSLGVRACGLSVSADRQAVATLDGRVLVLDELGETRALLDTSTARPVSRVAIAGDDVYCSVDGEVHHFSVDAGSSLTGAGQTSRRPLQVERSLAGRVQGLVVFHDRSAVVRLSTSELHLLHPVHLGPLKRLLDARDSKFLSVAVNQKFLALLAHSTIRGRGTYEIVVFYRRGRGSVTDLTQVERFEVDVSRPVRLAFTSRDRSALLIVGDRHLVSIPEERHSPRYFELDVLAQRGVVQSARVAPRRQRPAVLVAYGDGAIEEIDLESRKREYIVDAPDGEHDPLVGFVAQDRRTLSTWVLTRSGVLRKLDLSR